MDGDVSDGGSADPVKTFHCKRALKRLVWRLDDRTFVVVVDIYSGLIHLIHLTLYLKWRTCKSCAVGA
jgi:hypothetical protein